MMLVRLLGDGVSLWYGTHLAQTMGRLNVVFQCHLWFYSIRGGRDVLFRELLLVIPWGQPGPLQERQRPVHLISPGPHATPDVPNPSPALAVQPSVQQLLRHHL